MTSTSQDGEVTLATVGPGDLPAFKSEMEASFAVAVIEELGSLPEDSIPRGSELDESMNAPGTELLHILCDGERVGGAVVVIDEATQRNSLDLLFLSPVQHGRGLGFKAWMAIERRYPATLVWETHTPYFEKRNIHSTLRVVGYNSYHAPIQKVASSAMKARASLCHRTLGDKPPGQVSIAGAVVAD